MHYSMKLFAVNILWEVFLLFFTMDCMLIPTHSLRYMYPCEAGTQYIHLEANNSVSCIDCTICPIGYGTTRDGECFGLNDTQCRPCDVNQEYSVLVGISRECFHCDECSENQQVVQQCNLTHDVTCECKPGYYFDEDEYACVSSKLELGVSSTEMSHLTGLLWTKEFNNTGMITTVMNPTTNIIFILPAVVAVGIAVVISVTIVIFARNKHNRCIKQQKAEGSDDTRILTITPKNESHI